MLSQDPVGQTPSNQWEDLIFDQSRVIEPRDQPYKKAVSNSFPRMIKQCHNVNYVMFLLYVVLLFFFLSIYFFILF